MSMLPSRLFLSEPDAFLRELKRTHPELARKQQDGMRLWWNQPAIDVKTQREMDKDRVAQTPYVYRSI